jgi:hypothetical protein
VAERASRTLARCSDDERLSEEEEQEQEMEEDVPAPRPKRRRSPSPGVANNSTRKPRVVPLTDTKVTNAVHARLSKLASSARRQAGAMDAYRAGLNTDEHATQRSMDRLAWVLSHLNDARECVAVAVLHLDDEPRLLAWANKWDEDLVDDLDRLIKAAAKSGKESKSALAELQERLEKSKLDQRQDPSGEKLGALYEKAQRRLEKTLTFLAKLLEEHEELTLDAPQDIYASGVPHAEQQGADFLVKAGKKKLDSPVGISKLCCYLCNRALTALAEAREVVMRTAGSHFKTYANWPIPEHLRDKDEIRRFLGLPADESHWTDEDRLLNRAIGESDERVLAAIRSFDGSQGHGTTDFVSSGSEGEEEEPEERKAVVRGRGRGGRARGRVRGRGGSVAVAHTGRGSRGGRGNR